MARKPRKPDPKQRAELMAGVLAAPDDDGPRLVLADWLMEHGDPRGEFIAVQCAAAQIPYGEQREKAADLEERSLDLRKRYAATWTSFFRGMKQRPQYEFHRGFIHHVRVMRPEHLDATIARVLAVEPVESLTLENLHADLEGTRRTLALPRLAAISRLVAIAYNVKDQLAELLVEAPTLHRLRTLMYGHFGGDRAIELLANAPNLGALEVLDVKHGAITDAGIAKLAEATGLPRLRSLNLSNNQLTDAGAQALIDARGLPSLKRLSVHANNAITPPLHQALRRRFESLYG
jgi:uncharacterized protein (TIGR02996 family)